MLSKALPPGFRAITVVAPPISIIVFLILSLLHPAVPSVDSELLYLDYDDDAVGIGKSFDMRFEVPAGKNFDCYSHKLQPGEVLLMDFEVVQTSSAIELGLGFTVLNGSKAEMVNLREPMTKGNFREESLEGGLFHICFHNDHDWVYDKEVLFYLSAYKQDGWGNYNKELTELDLVVGNFTQDFSYVETQVTEMLRHLHHSRAVEHRDQAIIQATSNYISFWSTFNVFLIIGTGLLQVVFVRSLFDKDGSRGLCSLWAGALKI